MRPRRAEPPLVLVVEDEPEVCDFAETVIADELGCRTLAAANAREAILLLREFERIDVMFTDVTLPDGPAAMDGLELARKAVEPHPGLRVIYTTGGGQTDSVTVQFVEEGSFLPKPYTVKQLMRELSEHIILAHDR